MCTSTRSRASKHAHSNAHADRTRLVSWPFSYPSRGPSRVALARLAAARAIAGTSCAACARRSRTSRPSRREAANRPAPKCPAPKCPAPKCPAPKCLAKDQLGSLLTYGLRAGSIV
eukprot:6214446-Pleurochrysis_carterae.AAC.1